MDWDSEAIGRYWYVILDCGSLKCYCAALQPVNRNRFRIFHESPWSSQIQKKMLLFSLRLKVHTGTFFTITNGGSGHSNVQIQRPSVLWESIGPCTLPITRKLRASRDAVTRNLPILLLSIVILAFLPSLLLLTAGPSISPSKIQMGVGQKRGKANSQLTYRISCEMNSGCIAETGTREHLFLRKYCQSSLCLRREKKLHAKLRYDLIEQRSKLDHGHRRIHA